MQIWFLSNGSYSLKKCHNPFGKAIQPPPPYGKIPVEHLKSLRGASLRSRVPRFWDLRYLGHKVQGTKDWGPEAQGLMALEP